MCASFFIRCIEFADDLNFGLTIVMMGASLLLQMQTITASVIEDKGKDKYVICLVPSPKRVMDARGLIECVSSIQGHLSSDM